jgi:hypothetical protein
MARVVEAPPQFVDAPVITPRLPADGCKGYPAGVALPLRLETTVFDPDGQVSGCQPPENGGRLSVEWTLSAPGRSRATLAPPGAGGDCAPCPPAVGAPIPNFATDTDRAEWDIACLCPDLGGAAQALTYTVELSVTDGVTSITSKAIDVPVYADAPPCLDGAYPPPGSYVVDRAEPWVFEMSPPISERDAATIGWSLWRSSDPAWRAVPGDGTGAASYAPDLSSFNVGEHVKVRATAVGGTGAGPTCAVDQAVCAISSCLSQSGIVAECDAWVTWDLELR